MIRVLICLTLLLSSLLTWPGIGEGSQSLDRDIYVLTSLPVIADIVSNVAGDRARVESLINPGVNAASYELVPSDSERIADADIFMYVGYGNEAVLGAYARAIRDGRNVVSLLDLMGLNSSAPYFWLDPSLTKKLVERVARLLATLDPEGENQYLHNAAEYAKKIDELDEWISSQVEALPYEKRKIVTVRNTFIFFAERYGLEIVGYVTGYAGMYEPQTAKVTELLDEALAKGVGVFFIEYEESATTLREVLETLAEEAGIEVAGYLYVESLAPDLGVNTYLGMMRRNAELIVRKLSYSSPPTEGGEGSRGSFDNPVLRPFKYEFMRRGAITLLLTVLAASLVGAFAVLRGWAIFGDALSHGSIIGLVAAYLLSIDYFLGALAAGLAVALAVSSVERRTRLRTDVIIAVTFTTMLALAIAIISYVGGVTVSIEDILFADVTAVSKDMMVRAVATSLVVIVFVTLFGRVLLMYVIDPLGASALGFRTGMIHYTLLLLLAFTIVSAFMAIGAIPAFASLITPPAAAFLISKRAVDFIAKSVAIALKSAIAGLYISYYVGTNAGAATIIVAAAIFAATVVYKSLSK